MGVPKSFLLNNILEADFPHPEEIALDNKENLAHKTGQIKVYNGQTESPCTK